MTNLINHHAPTIFMVSILVLNSNAQDYKNLWNQCQKYNTIALDEYKKCHEEWNDLNKKQEKLELKFNMTQDYLNTCQEASTNLSFLVVLPWFILAMNICGILIHCCVRRKRRFKLGRFVFGLDMMDHQSNQSLTERNSMTNFNSQNTISAIECAPLK